VYIVTVGSDGAPVPVRANGDRRMRVVYPPLQSRMEAHR
jgi:hypothetical protein